MSIKIDQHWLEQIIREVLADLNYEVPDTDEAYIDQKCSTADKVVETQHAGITTPEARNEVLITNPIDLEALQRMKQSTIARIGVGKAGARLRTRTQLTLRADHAAARDAVFMDADEQLINKLGLFEVQSRCTEKNQHLTRPDLGRLLSDASVAMLEKRCKRNPDIQIIASDGLSSAAINANLSDVLPVITDGLEQRGVSVGTSFFVKYGRVGVMDHISEVLGAKVTCILIGERPGLATAESMSAYIAYNARIGMPESRRTVVSNIHRNGIPAVEAGAYISDLLISILKAKTSGVDIKGRGLT